VPVKFLVGGPEGASLRERPFADLAPTMLELMGMDLPPEMTGQSLDQPDDPRALCLCFCPLASPRRKRNPVVAPKAEAAVASVAWRRECLWVPADTAEDRIASLTQTVRA